LKDGGKWAFCLINQIVCSNVYSPMQIKLSLLMELIT
jgi:hypothetical protein